MKPDSKVGLALVAAFFGTVPFVFGQTTMIQPGQQVMEAANPQDLVPEAGQRGSTNPTPTPSHHDITEDDSRGEGADGTPAPYQTVYDKNNPAAEQERPNAYTSEDRGRITHGKRAERMIVTKSSKPVKIEKTKDGSSDATVSTGAFKDSLLDSGLAHKTRKSVAMDSLFDPDAEVAPEPSATPQAPVSAKPRARSTPSQERFDLSLGVGPAAAPATSPHPSDKNEAPEH